MKLDERRIELYSRQILLRELGGRGQVRLLEASCLLAGSGAALDTTATYLAGAGLGSIELLPAIGREGDSIEGFAPLGDRGDQAPRLLAEAPEAIDLAAFDVVVVASNGPARLAAAHGRPRLGTVRLTALDAARVVLVLVPSTSAACFACALPELPTRLATGFAASASDDALVDGCLAGTLAALAVCRWVAGFGLDTAPRGFYLDPDAPTWVEVDVARVVECPRGCRV